MNLTTRQGKNVTGTFNASDVDDDPLTYVTSQPGHGNVTLTKDGNFTYTPFGSFEGVDSFKYRANDMIKDSNEAVITVNVTHKKPSIAKDLDFNAKQAKNLTNTLNATDVDGDPLTFVLVSPPDHGILNLTSDGRFTYNPGNYTGPVTFKYKANYMGIVDSNTTTVTINVVPKQLPTANNINFTVR